MKTLIFISILLITCLNVNAQGIGELAPEKAPEVFPDNAFGLDIMFSEGGFGFGTFYRRQLSQKFTLFTDFSISEAKDENEFEYIDYFGNAYSIGKKNRIFLLPLNFGIQYRLFESVIADNLRPYINAGVGPTLVVTTPYELEFFNSFGKAHARYAMGSYFGFGANFGLDKSSLVGINLRYYIVHFFDEGVESLEGKFKKNLGGVYLTINIGMMY
ncbi:MAG: hypothetical protein IPM56_05025 [Ignavibacteriales bacterium]|nr:MAG: hypothetical protein IPM56_05025 [Ignavibacteriales bacterium]